MIKKAPQPPLSAEIREGGIGKVGLPLPLLEKVRDYINLSILQLNRGKI